MLCNRKLLANNFLYKLMVRSGRIQIHDRLIEELDCPKKFRIGEAKVTELQCTVGKKQACPGYERQETK